MKKVLLSLSCFAVMASAIAQDCTKIFISEYVEGWGNNKALEIYNPTDQPVNLSEYFVARVRDGLGLSSLTSQNCVQLTGILQPHSTHVGVLDKRNPAGTGQEAPIWDSLEVKADAFYSAVYNNNNAWYWNGNDAVALFKGNASTPLSTSNVLYDIMGKHNQQTAVGWSTVSPYDGTAGGANDIIVTEDHSLIRKPSIKRGLTIQEAAAVGYIFNPLEQWDSIPAVVNRLDENGNPILNNQGNNVVDGNWSTLRWHACECDPASLGVDAMNLDEIKLYPNPTTGAFTISGLEKVATIEVYNSLGQEVTTIRNNTQASVSFDLTEKTGIYMVTVTDHSGRSATQKVIVK